MTLEVLGAREDFATVLNRACIRPAATSLKQRVLCGHWPTPCFLGEVGYGYGIRTTQSPAAAFDAAFDG